MSHEVRIGDATLSYLRSGQGAALIVVHGVGGHKEDWQATAAALSATRTVYLVDMLGFGASSKSGQVIRIDDQVAALLALMDAEGVRKADLLGNSVGGWVVATMAARYPERVNKLILVDVAGFKAMFDGPPPLDFYPRTVPLMQQLMRAVRFSAEAHTETFAERALEVARTASDAEAAEAVGKGLFESERLEEVADRIAAPTLVVWGSEDRLFPPAIADLVASHVRGSMKVLIPQAGHFPQLDNPRLFHDAVREFLSMQGGGARASAP